MVIFQGVVKFGIVYIHTFKYRFSFIKAIEHIYLFYKSKIPNIPIWKSKPIFLVMIHILSYQNRFNDMPFNNFYAGTGIKPSKEKVQWLKI